nr:right-handed parallel beta-helix repeat-containing protein [Microbacterium endophyticum]
MSATTYSGEFTVTTSGTASAPITLCSSNDATISPQSTSTGYGLHLDHADYWKLDGFSITGGKKGIMLDASSHNELTNLKVSGTGEEGIHLRTHSSDNIVSSSTIHDTGLSNPEFGEGIYVGSAESNWCRYTECQPDRSDRNVLTRNHVYDVAAEAIDIKEGTGDGTISENTLSTPETTTVDSVVDIKGSGWTARENRISAALGAGIQVHRVNADSGAQNVITANTFDVAASQYAIEIAGAAQSAGNTVTCDNAIVDSTASAPSNIACSPNR